MKHIALICNPTAENEKALKAADVVSKLLKQQGVSHVIYVNPWPDSLNEHTDAWVFGGDGTLFHFINRYPDVQIPLSCFKAGSGNDFHWMLYGDTGVAEQAMQLLQANTQRVDAGTCNGKLFLNGVGIGFDGAIVNDLVGKKKVAGKASYLVTILKNLFSYREKFLNIDLGDHGVSQDCFMVSVANGRRYGGGFMVAPEAALTDGLLDISIVAKIPPLKRMRYIPLIEKGEHLQLPIIQYYKRDKVVIKASQPLPAHLDGEYLETDHFEISVLASKFLFSVLP